jgi:hypothetical protein
MNQTIQNLQLSWKQAMAAGQWRRGVQFAAEGFVLATQSNDEQERVFLGMLHLAIQKIATSEVQPPIDEHCSFCGRADNIKRSVRGATAQICGSCVKNAYDILYAAGGT